MKKLYLNKEPGRAFTGNLREILNDPFTFLNAQYISQPFLARYGAGPVDLYSVGDPTLVRQVLTDKSVEKARLNRKLFNPVIGNGLLASEGELWKVQRKAISHIFRPKKMFNYQSLMTDPVNKLVKKLESQKNVNITGEATAVTIQILVRSIFGLDNEFSVGSLEKHLEILAHQFVNRVSSIVQIPLWIPTKQNRIMSASAQAVLEIVENLINEHDKLNTEQTQDTLINALRASEDDQGRKMSDQQVFDEVATFFLAGHEATSTTLQWAIYNLSKYPEKQIKLRQELQENLGMKDADKNDLDSLPYLKAVVDETLRLFPTCYVQVREVATKDYLLDGYSLKRGSILAVPVYAMHRNEEWYPEPESFLPERWLNDSTKNIPKQAFMPFGGGKRVCIGEHFSRYELMTLLAYIYRTLASTLPEKDTPPGILPAVTLRPDREMFINFSKLPSA